MVAFQTIQDFVENPFGNAKEEKRNKLEEQYQKMKSKRDFRVEGFTTIDDNYLIHITIPSESNQSQVYDVVVLFFTDDTVIKKRTTFSNYYVKFFSNSPSFIYHYAYLYEQNGFLIDALYDKLDPSFRGVKPKQTNQSMELYYDKSIYCACRLLLDNNLILLSKLGIITKHKKSQTKFFSDIKSFENIKMANDIKTMDKKINKELSENKKVQKSKPGKDTIQRKKGKSNTLGKGSKPAIRMVQKKTGNKKKSSSNRKIQPVRKIPKK